MKKQQIWKSLDSSSASHDEGLLLNEVFVGRSSLTQTRWNWIFCFGHFNCWLFRLFVSVVECSCVRLYVCSFVRLFVSIVDCFGRFLRKIFSGDQQLPRERDGESGVGNFDPPSAKKRSKRFLGLKRWIMFSFVIFYLVVLEYKVIKFLEKGQINNFHLRKSCNVV
jgi:hypothetical protein